MDLKTLRYFVVVAEELNITRASKILMMSQPPLSNQIKNLEEELNTTLFIRGKRHLELTDEGRYLYQKAKDILLLNDKTINEILLMNKGKCIKCEDEKEAIEKQRLYFPLLQRS